MFTKFLKTIKDTKFQSNVQSSYKYYLEPSGYLFSLKSEVYYNSFELFFNIFSLWMNLIAYKESMNEMN